MAPARIGRRQLLTSAGGALVFTLAGSRVSADAHVDVDALSRDVPVPPAAAGGDTWTPQLAAEVRADAAAAGGTVREYWIAAVKTPWDIVPTHHDAMMDMPVKGRTRFEAMAYRPYHPGFRAPLGPPQIPGPLLEAQTSDMIVVHFRNDTHVPVTMHPHGIFYPPHMDGTFAGRYTTPGGHVGHGQEFTYIWEAREGTEGAWFYHDHGPMDPLPVFKGMFGPLVIRRPGDPRPDREFFLAFHSFTPLSTNLPNTFSCINGRAYAGNTPTLRARVGETVAFHVYGMDDDFHVFHTHGHRWSDPDGGLLIDSEVLGPGKVVSAQWVEDNPGRWFYHCHVFSHLHMGMNGWYLVER